MEKRDEERLIIEYFRKHYPYFPKGKLVKSESPDFILKITPKKTIGIELTRLDPFANSLKEKIEISLQKKAGKFSNYQQPKFNEIWLIIHADFVEESKSFNIQNKIDNWRFPSEYKRVFFFDLFEKRIYQIYL
jgi:hypothetical protein